MPAQIKQTTIEKSADLFMIPSAPSNDFFSDNDAPKWSTSAGEKSSEAKNQPWFDAQNAIAQLQETIPSS
jgi:hypothetical protein